MGISLQILFSHTFSLSQSILVSCSSYTIKSKSIEQAITTGKTCKHWAEFNGKRWTVEWNWASGPLVFKNKVTFYKGDSKKKSAKSEP